MKPDQFLQKIHNVRLSEWSAPHLAIGALLAVTILYASVMV